MYMYNYVYLYIYMYVYTYVYTCTFTNYVYMLVIRSFCGLPTVYHPQPILMYM